METVLTGEPIPKVDPILVLELVLEMDPIPQIPIPAQNTVIPCPILIPTKNGIKTSLVTHLIAIPVLCLRHNRRMIRMRTTCSWAASQIVTFCCTANIYASLIT